MSTPITPASSMTLKAKGITVEAWIYLTERPTRLETIAANSHERRWIIFAKPFSYFVTDTPEGI